MTLAERNERNMYRWNLKRTLRQPHCGCPDCDPPDPRTDEQRESYERMMLRSRIRRHWLYGKERINAKLEAGACFGIGDAPGTARVIEIEYESRRYDVLPVTARIRAKYPAGSTLNAKTELMDDVLE